MMIERLENALQIAVLLFCCCITIYRALRLRSRVWIFLTFFYGSWLLGDIYWTTCLFFFKQTPQISIVSDLSWYASFIFMYMLLHQIAPPQGNSRAWLVPWLGPVFTLAMAIYYTLWGQLLNNLIYALLMGLLLYAVIYRLCERKQYARQTALCQTILVFCLMEHALWTSSCIWSGDTLLNPYYWCDLLLTLTFPFFLRATRKAVSA